MQWSVVYTMFRAPDILIRESKRDHQSLVHYENFPYKNKNLDLVLLLRFLKQKNEPTVYGWGMDSWDSSVQFVKQDILDMKSITHEMGSQLLVVYIPTKEQAYSYVLEGKYSFPHLDVINDTLQKICSDSSIPFFDLTSSIRNQAKLEKEQLYFRSDGHWNANGHALASECIGNWFKENKGFIKK